MRFFFYGSLLDPAIRRAVMGRRAERSSIAPAVLTGWRRCRRREPLYPILLRAARGIVEGCLVENVDAAAAARLNAFEGPAYRVALVPVRTTVDGVVSAYVFLPSRRLASPSRWDPAEWSRGRQRRALRLAKAEMASEERIAMGRLLIRWQRRAVASRQ
ncbi:MAG: gamma-glutamylcyclotransferase [Alphaproteobacteria bacterium]|nr:gamma-glutamylcyclotransferase [Alphaproteobacteria bacterium]